MTDDTLYEQLGGRAAIEAVVDEFYERVLEDERLAGYFDDADLEELRAHQTAFVVQVAGGPEEYDGRSLREVHADLGVTSEDFAAVAEHLRASLEALSVPEEQAEALLAEVAALEAEVVTA